MAFRSVIYWVYCFDFLGRVSRFSYIHVKKKFIFSHKNGILVV